MIKKISLTLILFLLFIVSMQGIFALTADSPNYSVSRFGSGSQAANFDSSSFEGHSALLTEAGTRNAENNEFFVNVGFFEGSHYYSSVSITSYSISPNSAVVGSTIGFFVSALNSQSIWAKITAPNNQQQILILTNNQFVFYLPNPSILGEYKVVFYANSSSGEIASVVSSFDLIEQVTSSPPSGGGTIVITEKCAYIWDCSSWSVCSEGVQKRECNNIGNCTGIEGKPIEERLCSDALFDVLLKFGNPKITLDDTLNFTVDLTETKGIEKIDVQIKYSIINKNNTELFSQIETRAIDGRLTYEKELNEVKLVAGEYTLRVDILYGNLQRAFAEQKFKINDKRGILSELTLTGRTIEELTPSINQATQFLLIIFVLIILFVLRKKIYRFLLKNYPHPNLSQGKSIKQLISKKVYSEGGHYIGKIKEVILRENRIDGLKIRLDKKIKANTEGIIVSYKQVKSVSEIVIIDEKIFEHLEKYKV